MGIQIASNDHRLTGTTSLGFSLSVRPSLCGSTSLITINHKQMGSTSICPWKYRPTDLKNSWTPGVQEVGSTKEGPEKDQNIPAPARPTRHQILTGRRPDQGNQGPAKLVGYRPGPGRNKAVFPHSRKEAILPNTKFHQRATHRH